MWSVRVYSLRMLFDFVPGRLVEPDKFIGLAGSARRYRFLIDSRDVPKRSERLDGSELMCFQRIPLSHYELRCVCLEGAEPDARHRPD